MSNCLTCPSRLDPREDHERDQVINLFGRNPGAPICGRYGHVLGRPGMSDAEEQKVGEHYASHCDAFGEPLPGTPVSISTRVVTPDTQAIQAAMTRDNNGGHADGLTTCAQCEHHVDADVVATDFGFTMPICRAKGTLIMKPRAECRGCPYATRKTTAVQTRTTGLELLPEFLPGFTPDVGLAVKAAVAHGNTQADPRTYVTDKPVTPEDDAAGIRAWRKVTDPNGSGNMTHLPIYKPEYLTEEERRMIPQAGSDEHPELYVDYDGRLYFFAVEGYELDETPILNGPPGIGKTEFARWVAYLMQIPFRRFSCNGSTDVDDLIGKWVFIDNKTMFQRGRLPQAWERPGVLVLDEPNTLPDDAWQLIRPLCDNSRQLVLDQAAGEEVVRHQACYFLMAMNPSWDMRNIGTKEVSDADTNRLSVMYVEMPPESIERHIIAEACRVIDGYELPQVKLDTIMRIAADIRQLVAQGSYPGTWGIRQQIKVARKTRWYGFVDAYRRSALDFYEPETAKLVLNAVTDNAPEAVLNG